MTASGRAGAVRSGPARSRASRRAAFLVALLAVGCGPRSCGPNASGQVDAGSDVPGSTITAHLSVNTQFGTCVVGQDRLRCWGEATTTALQRAILDSQRSAPWPARLPPVEPWSDLPVRAHVGAQGVGCVLSRAGGIDCASAVDRYPLGLEDVDAAAVNGDFGCAIHDGRKLSCWRFQPGLPSAVNEVRGVSAPEEVVLGDRAGCARTATGKLYCWSLSDAGVPSPATLTFAFPAEARHLAFWGQQLCAFVPGARPQCTRAPVAGPREPTTGDDRHTPYPRVPEAAPWTSAAPELPQSAVRAQSWLSAQGGARGCVLSRDGRLSCFGPNSFGDVGDGTTVPRHALVPLPLENVEEFAVGMSHACALLLGGQIACWGSNRSGQLGQLLVGVRELALPEAGRVVDLDVSEHACVVVDSGAVYCWGKSFSGQAGARRFFVEPPLKLGLDVPVTRVVAGNEHTCAWGAHGVPRCWGDNFFGQLGDGTREDRSAPAPVKGLEQVVAISGQCALVEGGALFCWGDGPGLAAEQRAGPRPPYPHWPAPRLARALPGIRGRTLRASAGAIQPACVIEMSGALTCLDPSPMRIPIPDPVVEVALVGGRGCALTRAGEPWCWDELTSIEHPRRILAPEPAIAVAVAATSACAVLASGESHCWGKNVLSLGDAWPEPRRIPVPPATQLLLTRAGIGCVVAGTGEVTCWDPLTGAPPAPVPELANASLLKSGAYHVCAARSSRVFCHGVWQHSSRPVALTP